MTLVYNPKISAFGQNFTPADGALLYFYEAGTTTPKTVYTDRGETIAHANPVVADAGGVFAPIYVSGLYKMVLKDKNGVTQWTEDNLTGFGDAWSQQGSFDSSSNAGDYPLTGNTGDAYRTTEEFTLNAASGSHTVYIGDYIVCNKVDASPIDADWDIIRGRNINLADIDIDGGTDIGADIADGDLLIVDDGAGGTNRKTEAYRLRRDTDWSAKNLVVEQKTVATIDATAKVLALLNSSGNLAFIDDLDTTFDITTDKMSGTSEKASTWYQLWLSVSVSGGAVTRMMVPDLTGTADADVSNSLSCSTATFETDLVQPGDELYNLDDNTKGYVGAVSSETVLTCVDGDGNALDLFPDGDEDYVIHMLSPTGLGAFKANIGAGYNDSGSDLESSVQIGKTVIFNGVDVLTDGGMSTYTKIPLSIAVPVTAKKAILGDVDCNDTDAGTLAIIATDSSGNGERILELGTGDSGSTKIAAPFDVKIRYPQYIWYKAISSKLSMSISGYEI